MTTKLHGLRQRSYTFAAIVAAFAVGAVGFLPSFAEAGQVQTRSIQLSDSSPSGNAAITSGVGSGTNVTYNVTFTPATSGNIGGIVVDICDSTPIIGDTSCTYPTGFNWGSATPALTAGFTGMGAGWTAAAAAGGGSANYQVLKLSNGTPQSVSTGTPINFNITGVTNPSTANHSFYARIVTFDTSANMTSQYTTAGTVRAASYANMVDYGGVAMSTASPITISARVMESLSLCTSAVIPNLGCSNATAPALVLGHGPNKILDASAVDTGSVYSQLSTNAQTGAVIRMHSSNACGGLSKDGGTTCPIAAAGASLITINNGDAKFGVETSGGSAVGGGSGSATLNAKYSSGTQYAMDTTTASNNVTYLYGDPMASTSGAVNGVNVTYTFAAGASNTTPAGIYTTNESLIGTGTF